jgi:hypothetical protein
MKIMFTLYIWNASRTVAGDLSAPALKGWHDVISI